MASADQHKGGGRVLIPKDYITEWRPKAPWTEDAQVEQDLVICKALVELFNHDDIYPNLAFRGGTALFKLFFDPVRYSEDIDLVQIKEGPIGPVMGAVREVLDPWLGSPSWRQTEGRVKFRYGFESEDGLPLKLKVEINTREHFSVYRLNSHPFSVESRWFKGSTNIFTYEIEELLGTKLRALYQRKKGRDLFDLWYAFKNRDTLDPFRVVESFLQYMERGEHTITRTLFERNLIEKKEDTNFRNDTNYLLTREGEWDFEEAFDFVMNSLIARVPGEPWRGKGIAQFTA